MAFSDDLCCALTVALGAGDDCVRLPGGITDIRIGCLKYFAAYTEGACTTPATAYVTAITAQDPVTAAAVVPLYAAFSKEKTAQFSFELNYDGDTDSNKIVESITFDITAIGTQTRCALLEYRGQEVVTFFKYRGSDKWYMSGWKGGMRVTTITGGSGLDNRQRTNVVISGDDLEEAAIEVFDTDVATTDTLVDNLTN